MGKRLRSNKRLDKPVKELGKEYTERKGIRVPSRKVKTDNSGSYVNMPDWKKYVKDRG